METKALTQICRKGPCMHKEIVESLLLIIHQVYKDYKYSFQEKSAWYQQGMLTYNINQG